MLTADARDTGWLEVIRNPDQVARFRLRNRTHIQSTITEAGSGAQSDKLKLLEIEDLNG
jgi:hypothetical protein